MKTAVALTPENTAVLAWCSELTGLPAEELINFFLAEYFENFNEDNQDNFCEETIGLLKFKDREAPPARLRGSKDVSGKGTKANSKMPLRTRRRSCYSSFHDPRRSRFYGKCCNFIVFRCENGSTNLLHTFGVSTAVQP